MWRDHLPYSNVKQVAKIDNICYGATDYGLYKIDEEELSIEQLNTVFGLSDFLIGTISANEYTKTLIIGYANGNIDLIKDGKVMNINAIVTSSVVGDRSIYGIHNDGKYAYLACGFGIVVMDLQKQEIKDTYYIGTNGQNMRINDVTIGNSRIYVATESGIYSADQSTPFLSDFNAWSRHENFGNYDNEYHLIHFHNDNIITVNQGSSYADDTLKVFDVNFNELFKLSGDDYKGIESKTNSEFIICQNNNLRISDNNFNIVETIYTYNGNSNVNCNHAIWDGTNYWIGDLYRGLNRQTSNWDNKNFYISGPLNNNNFQMTSLGEHVYISSGLVTGSGWNNSYNSSGVFVFDQYNWTYHNVNSEEMIYQDSSFDFIYSAVDPNDENHALFCSFHGGLHEYLDGKVIQRYSTVNSALQYSLVHNKQTKVSAAQFDSEGNIWAANSYVNEPLVLISKDGTSQSFSIGSAGINAVITDLLIADNSSQIWIAVRNKGIVVYDYKDTPKDPSDDEYILLNATEGNGGLPSENINCLTQDRDGEIWVGTEMGPAVFFSPSSIFSNTADVDAQQILILQDGSYQYLLETQIVTSIEVDGANRKWFGTGAGGVFLMSSDGTEQIYAFNTSNSPMFSNVVNSLTIVPETGELFIGTDKGVLGFRSTATEPETNYTDVYSFPNPVRNDYHGPIAIKGLTENSDVKIMDASGNLVNESRSYGGQAIWDGNDLYGNEVPSGVYYVNLVSQGGQLKTVTKVLIIR